MATGGGLGLNFTPSEGPKVEKKIAVLGHSFVLGLPLPGRINIDSEDRQIALVRKFFRPGATVANIQEGVNWGRYLAYKPDLTILVIGGNDIKPASKPVEIARAIIQLGKRIELETGGKVKILTIERRPVPVGVSAISYNR